VNKIWRIDESKTAIVAIDEDNIYTGEMIYEELNAAILDERIEKPDELNSMPFSYMRQVILRDDQERIIIKHGKKSTFAFQVSSNKQRSEIYQEIKLRFPKAKTIDRKASIMEKGGKPFAAIIAISIVFTVSLFFRLSDYSDGIYFAEGSQVTARADGVADSFLIMLVGMDASYFIGLFIVLYVLSIGAFILKVKVDRFNKRIIIK